MDARVVKTHSNGQQVVVTVGFFDAQDKELLQKVYYLDPAKDLDSLKPQIKDDLKEVEAAHKKAVELSDLKDKDKDKLDFTGIESVKEKQARIKAEEAAKNKPA